MKLLVYLFSLSTLVFCPGCDSEGDGGPGDSTTWLIPSHEVFDGGPGRDGIPSIDGPQFESASADFITDDELIVGIVVGGEARAYPHFILDWHEIVNDEIGNASIAVVYCPLTGTALGWDRNVAGVSTTFGVSGLLYNSNIIPYDRASGSNWSQMRLQCVNGQLIESTPTTYQIVETSWETWERFFPDTQILTPNTGHSRDYGRYPYGNYKTSPNLLFPTSDDDDDRLHPKERVHGVILENRVKVYRFESFASPAIVQDQFGSSSLTIVGSQKDNFIVSFEEKSIEGTVLTFDIPNDLVVNGTFASSALMEDQLGNRWNLFGHAVSGPNQGQRLIPTSSMMGYWFSFHPFYPNPEIFGLTEN